MRNIEQTHEIKKDAENILLRTNLGIYSDKVGSGKTLTLIGLISSSEPPKDHLQPTLGMTQYTYVSILKETRNVLYAHASLIIVPHSLICQWSSTLTMVSGLTFLVVNTQKKLNQLDFDRLPKVILISNTMYKRYVAAEEGADRIVVWDRLIIDEPHILALPDVPEANFTWLICATPVDILETNRVYLRRMIHGLLRNDRTYITEMVVIKNDPKLVEESLSLEPYHEVDIKCRAPSYLRDRAVRENLPSDALSRLQANDIAGAIEVLNCNSNSKSSIVDALIGNYKNKIHDENLEIERLRQLVNISNSDRAERIQAHLSKVDMYQKKVKSITERVTDDSKEAMCPICLDNVSEPRAITNCCQNAFCFECILMALKTSNMCPLCKANSCVKNLHVESEVEIKRKKPTTKLLSKANTLVKLLENMKEESRYLIFSEYDNSFNKIAWKLMEKGIPFETLKGRSDTQQNIIRNFNKGVVKILMLNAYNFGAGLNLQMTTDIVLFHRFKRESLCEQVIGRAHRPGRQSRLTVTHLKHEYE